MNGTFKINPVGQPDVETWWEWALGINEGPAGNTSFKVGGGRFINTNQTKPFFCASCTAASGGKDLFVRRLPPNGKDFFVPIFVSVGVSDSTIPSDGSCSDANETLLDKARKELRGPNDIEPTRYLFVDDQSIDTSPLYFESQPFVKMIANPNSFGAPAGNRCIVSAGWFEKIQGHLDVIRFGGTGGQISEDQPHEAFTTER